MASTLVCPTCEVRIKTAKPPTPGARVRCPKCKEVFTAPGEPEDTDEVEPSVKRAPKRRPKKKEPAPKAGVSPLVWVGVAGLALFLIAGVGLGAWFLSTPRQPTTTAEATKPAEPTKPSDPLEPVLAKYSAKASRDGNTVTKADFTRAKITDDDWAVVWKATELQDLTLNYTTINDADLLKFQNHRKLKYLRVVGTGVTEAGALVFKKVASWTTIEPSRDSFYNLAVNANMDALSAIRQFNDGSHSLDGEGKLEKIFLSRKDRTITDDSFKLLSRYPSLTLVAVSGDPQNLTGVTDDGLKYLASLKNLRNLAIYNTKITDAGLLHLRGLTNLERLDLIGNTNITDRGIEQLGDLKKVKYISVGGTKVTKECVEFRRQHPDVVVDHHVPN